MTVATNRYLDYWFAMAQSAERYLFPDRDVVMHVFTDRVADAREMARAFSRVVVNPIEIEQYVWPEATLLRYQIFDTHRSQLSQDVLLHLDADMIVVDEVGPELRPDYWRGGIALVRHPGYRRPGLGAGSSLYFRNPRLAWSDARARMVVGGLGSWESDVRSRACVPRAKRKAYVCGGTWMGRRTELLSMIHELAEHTREDTQTGVMAVWHDESHLNWFASRYETSILGSEYCYAEGYANLSDLHPRIIAVVKGDERTR